MANGGDALAQAAQRQAKPGANMDTVDASEGGSTSGPASSKEALAAAGQILDLEGQAKQCLDRCAAVERVVLFFLSFPPMRPPFSVASHRGGRRFLPISHT